MDDKQREIAELEARLAALKAEPEPAPSAAPPEKRGNNLRVWGGVLLGLAVVVGIALSTRSGEPSEHANSFGAAAEAERAANAASAAADEAMAAAAAAGIGEPETSAPPPTGTTWSYRDQPDPMTDKLTRWACTTSTNRAMLDRPYEPVSADLCLRQSPRYGLDAIVQLNGAGQILCRSYDGCTLKIRFGDGAQQSFSGASAADGSSNVVFISNASRFITAVKSAPATKIQLTFYRAGDQVLEFNTDELEWPRPAT